MEGLDMAIYGYTRVSTARQASEGESLEVQKRTITGYALMLGLAIDQTFVEEGVSGSIALSDRKAGKALLAILRPGDVVITPKLDRMFRSARDALAVLDSLKARGISLHMIDLGGDVTGNGISKLVFTILSAVAEAERDRIRERITTVKADQKSRGLYLGGKIPFGWRLPPLSAEELAALDGKKRPACQLEEDEDAQRVLAYMRSSRASGMTLQAIQADIARLFDTKLSIGSIHGILDGIMKKAA
jgi:putative DNA-invertase from lambdoid prophage Rac